MSDTSQITSVWSAYGHRFMSDGEENYESCLTCGAMYELVPTADDPTRGEYCASNGDEPMECSHDTSMEHGYETDSVCNCVACS